jgi:hypothetical protein
MTISSKGLSVAAALAVLGVASTAHATFVVYDNIQVKDEIKILLDNQKDVTSDTAETVKNLGNVNVTTNVAADFANGFATIKPSGDDLLTTLTFTPTDPTAFNDFTFRGQDLVANQDFTVTVADNNGGTQTFTFNGGNANADFGRLGIISLDGETIQSVTVSNPGGFKEFKQPAFSTGGAVPEPATWAMMLVGVGLAGAQMRRSRARTANALI